jgi:DNA sulfur modification protein DndB
MSELGSRIEFSDQIRKRKELSNWLQRVLNEGRARDIAAYLREQDERFFNSLVVAVYGGEPYWFSAGRISSNHRDFDAHEVSDEVRESIGFLKLSGKERIFALDGQHRLAGIKQCLKDSDSNIASDHQSVLFIGHKESAKGEQRTRRLFTTLNKTAKPVSKSEIIALDEDDVMAITTRHLVENHPYFRGARIAFNSSANLSPSDKRSLTTIVNLYDILAVVFSGIDPKVPQSKLKHYRPPDEDLEIYRGAAQGYFDRLSRTFLKLEKYFTAEDFASLAARYRTANGGSVLFRPVGLLAVTEAIAVICKAKCTIDEALNLMKSAPLELSAPPFHNVLWSKSGGMTTKRALARDLLLYIVKPDALKKSRIEVIGRQYAVALGMDPNQWRASLDTLKKLRVQ